MAKLLLSGGAGVLLILTAFVLGMIAQSAAGDRTHACIRPPQVVRVIDLVDEFGCDSPALRLFVNGCEPQISFVTEWPYYKAEAFVE